MNSKEHSKENNKPHNKESTKQRNHETQLDVVQLNRQAWDIQSANVSSEWVVPVDGLTIDRARLDEWSVILTPNKAVPRNWFGTIRNREILGLASAGGQQMPVLAAAGGIVVSFDNSPVQLAKDADLAEQHALPLTTEQGDMTDLSRFEDASFDLIFHPVSNCFVPDIVPVWQECARVLRQGGRLLSGFMNPDFYLFDHEAIEHGAQATVTHKLPMRDTEILSDDEIRSRISEGYALEFSHSLDTQIGAQIEAGFAICGFYEDHWNVAATPLDAYMPTSMATLAIKET